MLALKFSLALLALVLLAGGYLLYSRSQQAAVTCVTDPLPVIVAFGDSLVTGYGVSASENPFTLLSASVGVPIRNLGVSGDTSANALVRVQQVIDSQPDIAIVVLGGNDALQQLPIKETEENLAMILKKLRDAGIRPVLIGVIGGFPKDPYAPMYERLSKKFDVELVPNVLSGLIGNEQYMSDAIHPNAAGYARMAERMLPVLVRACGKQQDNN